MKLNIVSETKQNKGSLELPAVFHEAIRTDLIRRAVLASASLARQPYGTDPRAGLKASAKLSRRRRKYRGGYGKGISRSPRKIMSHAGSQFRWQGALAPNTVGGMRAYPPRVDKVWEQKLNVKEKRKAIRSALAAVVDKALVVARGHKVPAEYPFAVVNELESLKNAKDVTKVLVALGLADELDRTKERSTKPGRAKMRGTGTRTKSGVLLVVGKACPLQHAARNVPGVDVVIASRVSVNDLAPGAAPGRLTIFTEGALDRIAKEKLFQ